MLDIFRKHATSWLIKVALGLIVIVFIFWGGYSSRSKKQTEVANIDGHYISVAEYNRSYDQLKEVYRRQLGNAYSEDLLKRFNVKQQALDMLIQRYLLAKSAKELGLAATDQEIQQKILEFPVFQTDGKFDEKRYVLVLRENRMTPEAFEQQVGEELTFKKVEAFVKRRAAVTNDEILADYRFSNSQIQLGYVLLDPKTFESQVSVDDNALKDFFEKHADQYKDPEKRQFGVVLFKTDQYVPDVQVSEDEIRQYYDQNQQEFHQQEEVHARHILFKVKEDAPEAEVAKVKAEAEKVLAEAKQGKDFAELAKKYSQDPGSAQNGGDLGFFARDRMVPAFSQAAFALKPGEISDLVRTPYGFHIIKVEEVHPEKTASLEEVHNQIATNLKQERARDIAYDKAREFADLAYAQKDIDKAAQEKKLTVSGIGTWLTQNEPLPGPDAAPPEVMSKLFALNDKEFSDILEVPQGFVVAQVQAVQPPQLPPLESVKDRVEKDFKADQARTLAQKKADELLASAKSSKDLEKLAQEQKLEYKKTDWFSRKTPDKDIKFQGEGLNKVFQLEEAQPFPEAPLNVVNRFMVCQLLGKKTPDAVPDGDQAEISKRLYKQKQDQVFQTWLDDQRSKAKVEIYREL